MSRSKLNADSTKGMGSRSLMSGVILLMIGVVYSPFTQAATAPVVVEACPSCASLTDLQNYAIEALGGFEPGYLNGAAVDTVNGITYYVQPQTLLGVVNPAGGTEIFVASKTYPIAAELRYNETILNVLGKPTTVYQAVPVTPNNMGTAALDALTHTRASGVPPINVPANYGTANTYADVDILTGFVNGVLVGTGQGGVSIWRYLTGYSQVEWLVVTDTQTGQLYTIWNGDEFTLKFSDGSTIKVEFTAIGGPHGITFTVEILSARDPNGKPYGIGGLLPGSGSTNYTCTASGALCTDLPAVPNLCYYAVQVCWYGSCTIGWDPCGS